MRGINNDPRAVSEAEKKRTFFWFIIALVVAAFFAGYALGGDDGYGKGLRTAERLNGSQTSVQADKLASHQAGE
jgi:hypothetical protein